MLWVWEVDGFDSTQAEFAVSSVEPHSSGTSEWVQTHVPVIKKLPAFNSGD
jgi:hypothetical protein